MNKRIKEILMLFLIILGLSGCMIKRDNLENVDIYTTVYPIEFIVDSLYGYNSNVSSIYPAEVNLDEYKLTDKQIKLIRRVQYLSIMVYQMRNLSQETYSIKIQI